MTTSGCLLAVVDLTAGLLDSVDYSLVDSLGYSCPFGHSGSRLVAHCFLFSFLGSYCFHPCLIDHHLWPQPEPSQPLRGSSHLTGRTSPIRYCFQMTACFLRHQSEPQSKRRCLELHQRNHWSADLHLLLTWLGWDPCCCSSAISPFDHELAEEHSPPAASLGKAFRYQPSFEDPNWQCSNGFGKYLPRILETEEAYQRMI